MIFTLENHPALAQDYNKIQELKNYVENAVNDSSKFFTTHELANVYSKFNFDSAEYFNQQNIDFAVEVESDYYMAHALFRKGANRVFSNQLQEAISVLNDALPTIARSGDKLLEARAHYYLGNLNYTTTQHAKAIHHYQKSLVLSDSIDWPKGRIDNRHNLAGVFFDIEDYEQSDQYILEAKKLVDELGDPLRIPMTLAVITEVSLVQEDFAKVDSVARIIIGMSDSLSTAEYHVPPSYLKLGQVQVRYGEYEQALVYFYEALNQLNNPNLNYPGPRDMKKAAAYYHIGATEYKLGKKLIAKKHLIKADSLAKNLDLYTVRRDASQLLWQIEDGDKNFQQALVHHQNYKAFSDSILNTETLKKMLKARVTQELEEREKEEANRLMLVQLKAEQQARTFYWIIVLVVMALVIVGLLLRIQYLKTRKEMQSRKEAQSSLEGKHRELAAYVLQLLRKNELLMEISGRLKRIRKSTRQDQQKELLGILQSISHNSKEIGWDEFELRFKEVHPAFYERLARHHPNLTANENRLCAFLKLNMTSKEISAFTFQTEHSIIQARSRLKKKLGLENGQKLSQFVTTL